MLCRVLVTQHKACQLLAIRPQRIFLYFACLCSAIIVMAWVVNLHGGFLIEVYARVSYSFNYIAFCKMHETDVKTGKSFHELHYLGVLNHSKIS